MKKTIAILGIIALLSLLLVACSQPSASPSPGTTAAPAPSSSAAAKPAAPASPGTAPAAASGTYYPKMISGVEMPKFLSIMGGGSPEAGYSLFAKSVEGAVKDYWPAVGTRVELGTMEQNCGRIQDKTADIAPVATSAEAVYLGKLPPKYVTPLPDLRTFAFIPSGNALLTVTLGDSKIKDISELANKKIFIGNPGSGSQQVANIMLEAGYGITQDSIKKAGGVLYVGGYEDAAQLLMAGDLDAFSDVNNHPTSFFMTIANGPRGMKALTWNEKSMTKILQDQGRAPSKLAAGTYKGLDKDLPTITGLWYILVRKDIPDDIVFNLLVASFDKEAARFKATVPALKPIDLLGVRPGVEPTIPWHPGAKKFWWDLWKGRGLLK